MTGKPDKILVGKVHIKRFEGKVGNHQARVLVDRVRDECCRQKD